MTPTVAGGELVAPSEPGPSGPISTGPVDGMRRIMAQPAIRKSLPAIAGLAMLAIVATAYFAFASGPQRVLYSSLSDSERAQVVEALDTGGISYQIDSATGMLTVPESELYRARMLVASNGALAAPETGASILDGIPMGASRTMETEKMRLARERELMLTIMEIDGIEAVRVHLATPERSVFVRDKVPPSASVMVRLAGGQSLETSQVEAIVNLVSGSVPGLSPGAVRVADQNGNLLSADNDQAGEGFDLQARYESKLQAQLASLLTPMLGNGNFSTEVQVELDRSENTSAREVYDQDGVIRNESEMRAVRSIAGQTGGVPGVLANTPPPPTELAEEAPQGGAAEAPQQGGDTEESAERSYAVGREVSVTSNGPGNVTRLSVAVAISEEALAAIAPADADQVKTLVEAAVGANADRGDSVTVVVGRFEETTLEPLPFYETAWFAMAARYATGLIAVLLVLLLGVRPILKMLRGEQMTPDDEEPNDELADGETQEMVDGGELRSTAPAGNLQEQIELARRLTIEQPERAVAALQRMLTPPAEKGGT